MAKCDNCGFELPEDAIFCPNCGTRVKEAELAEKRRENLGRIIMSSLMGVFLSLIISSIFSVAAEGIETYFVPTFISALIIIYASRVKSIKDAIIISALIYLFADALLSGLLLGTLYIRGMNLASYYSMYYKDAPTLIDVVLYTISPVTAVLAGVIGYKMVPKREVLYEQPREERGTMLFYILRSPLKKLKYLSLGFFIEAK